MAARGFNVWTLLVTVMVVAATCIAIASAQVRDGGP